MSVTAICGSIKAYGSHVEWKTARFSIQIELLRQMQNLRRPRESVDPFLPAFKKMGPRLRGDDAAASKRERVRARSWTSASLVRLLKLHQQLVAARHCHVERLLRAFLAAPHAFELFVDHVAQLHEVAHPDAP